MKNSKLSDIVRDNNVKWIGEHWYEYSDNMNIDDEALHFTFVNIPFDYAINYRPGARFGPESILAVLDNCTLYCADKRVSLDKNVVLSKYGTIVPEHSFEKSYKNIESQVSQIIKSAIPIFLGGDHSIVDPIFRGMCKKQGKKIGLVSFDTHFDFRTPVKGYEHSGSWLKTLEDVIDYNSVVIIGIGAPVYSDYYMQKLEELGALIITPYELRKSRKEEIVSKIVKHLKKSCEDIYITVDIDVLDQAFVTGTSAPNPNGMMAYELIDLIFEISSSIKVIGMDICEVSPHLDHYSNLTSNVAAQIAINFIAGVVKKRGNMMIQGV